MNIAPLGRWAGALTVSALLVGAPVSAQAQAPAPAARKWSPAQAKAILDATQTTRLAPDLSHLTPGERTAVAKLLAVGAIFAPPPRRDASGAVSLPAVRLCRPGGPLSRRYAGAQSL